jgi:hypothetical protein
MQMLAGLIHMQRVATNSPFSIPWLIFDTAKKVSAY